MRKWILPILVIIAILIFNFSNFLKFFNYEVIRYHHVELTEYVNNNPIATPFIYIGICIFTSTLSIPGGLLLTILGGFLFEQPWAYLYSLIGLTIGAVILFFTTKILINKCLKEKESFLFFKIKKNFDRNVISYMLFLRFITFFPFWLTNLVPAFFNIKLKDYIWTTIIGITPGVLILTITGQGFGVVFETSDQFHIKTIFNTQAIVTFVILAIASLTPVVIKKFIYKKNNY